MQSASLLLRWRYIKDGLPTRNFQSARRIAYPMDVLLTLSMTAMEAYDWPKLTPRMAGVDLQPPENQSRFVQGPAARYGAEGSDSFSSCTYMVRELAVREVILERLFVDGGPEKASFALLKVFEITAHVIELFGLNGETP